MDLFPDPSWTCQDIRHKRLRLVPPCGLQQLGRPVWRIRHTTPDGPPWLADLGLRRWYTHLVYPQQTRSIKFLKVQWSNHTEEEATWEREDYLQKEFPNLFSS
jgi:hypothetical protein